MQTEENLPFSSPTNCLTPTAYNTKATHTKSLQPGMAAQSTPDWGFCPIHRSCLSYTQVLSVLYTCPICPVHRSYLSYTRVLSVLYTSPICPVHRPYIDTSGASHQILSTQFESLAARKAFPCFDELRFKVRTSPLEISSHCFAYLPCVTKMRERGND